MLTLRTIVRATRQMGLYGELKGGALDHLASKVTGYALDRRTVPQSADVGSQSDTAGAPAVQMRVWDDDKGTFVIRDE